MKFLMLRGQVPQDRAPQEIVFDTIEEVDDVWTQLFFTMLDNDDSGELWYWGGNREKKFTHNFIERWVPSFETYKSSFIPDVIFCRGGFQEYHPVLKRFPNAIKIYYGAGRRYLPQPGFYDYDIILQDSWPQAYDSKSWIKLKSTSKKPEVRLFIKPAADNIFYPMPGIEKEYDVCFPANGAQKFKGHDFIYKTVPSNLKLLNLGNNPHNFDYPSNVTSYRVLRRDMAREMAKCKVGVVAVESEIDSCPRVIPEMLACDLPIVVLDTVRFWDAKYMTPTTGAVASRENYWDIVQYVLNNRGKYNPRKHYEENLSLNHAAKFLREEIEEVR